MVLRYPMRVKLGDETVCVFEHGTGWITAGKDWFRYDSSMQDVVRILPNIVEPFIVTYDANITPDEAFLKEVEWVTKLLK